MPSWLAPVWLDQSVRHGVRVWLPASQSATVGIRPAATASVSTRWPTPSSWTKTVPGTVSAPSPAIRGRLRSVSR